MPTDTVQPFDDPQLKAALKRAFGTERAPAGLRQRVLAALDEASGAPAPTLRLSEPMAKPLKPDVPRLSLNRFLRNPLVGLALAAMVVIVVGLAARTYLFPSQQKEIVVQLPRAFAEAMADVHDAAIAQLDPSAPALADADLTASAQQIGGKINNLQVLAPALPDGWTPRAAKLATVDGVPTAQVIYTRGDRSLSLFSVWTKRVYSAEDGSTYAQDANNHAIAGFVRNRITHCVVGDAKSTLDELKPLASALRTGKAGT